MAVNSDKPDRWKADIAQSVDLFNDWFMKFAPKAYRETRVETTRQVADALKWTSHLMNLEIDVLKKNPSVLPMLRMATAPPLARDRLIGLTGVSPNLVRVMELEERLPQNLPTTALDQQLRKIVQIIVQLADRDIFTWLESGDAPDKEGVYRAATIVADRLCGAIVDPLIRNAQEQRQLAVVKDWLEKHGYRYIKPGSGTTLENLQPGTFATRLNVPVKLENGTLINIPVDAAIKRLKLKPNQLPLFIEAKSAGDFTNTNKRRKEEATKMIQLRATFGRNVEYILFLCGYFDSGYLGYEAAEGIDWCGSTAQATSAHLDSSHARQCRVPATGTSGAARSTEGARGPESPWSIRDTDSAAPCANMSEIAPSEIRARR